MIKDVMFNESILENVGEVLSSPLPVSAVLDASPGLLAGMLAHENVDDTVPEALKRKNARGGILERKTDTLGMNHRIKTIGG